MVQTILSALAPIVFTLLLGFVAAWRHDFGPKEASVLNRMVLLYAVPLALFVGTVGTPRADLVQDIALVVAIFAAIVGLYALVFLLFRLVFRFSLSESVLAALTASAPAVPFMGPAILGDLIGKASAVTIAIAALIINLIVVPITILGLALGRTPIGTTRHSAFAEKLVETVKEPIVWAPVLAFVLVLCNVRIPSIADHGLSLLGQASGGVALFASGIMLAAYKIEIDLTALSLALLKNIVQPALVLVGLLSLGYGAPTVPEETRHDPSGSPRQICRSRLVRRTLGAVAPAVAGPHPGLPRLLYRRLGRRRLASSRLARHARLRHDGCHPTSGQQADAQKNQVERNAKTSDLIPWSIQEIRRIAQRLARKRIQPADVIAWSLWRRAHQAAA